MARFRRILHFAYVIASAVALAMLVLPWRGPWTGFFNPLFAESEVYALILFACLGASIAGLIVILVKTILMPSERRSITIEQVDGGSITLDIEAVNSQVKYLIEGQGSCEVEKIKTSAKGKDKVAIEASLKPYRAANLSELGATLQNMVLEKLNEFTGGAVDSVVLHFLAAEDQAFEYEEPISPFDLQIGYPTDDELSGADSAAMAEESLGSAYEPEVSAEAVEVVVAESAVSAEPAEPAQIILDDVSPNDEGSEA